MVPQVLSWVYFSWLIDPSYNNRIPFHKVNSDFFLFFLALVSISAFGYLLNDLFDVESDAIAGKQNSLSRFGVYIRWLLVLVPLLIGVCAWLKLPFRPGATILLALQIVALILYSAPPVRLKERAFWGVIADAFYGHINPVFITLTYFLPGYSKPGLVGLIFLGVVFICLALKGLRNILLHQIEDRKKDRRAGTETFVVKNGGLYTLNLVNRILPLELFFTICLAISISIILPPYFLSVLLFSVLTYLKFSGWKLAYLPGRQLKFKFLYFLNDYFEGWMPVFFLVLLSVQNQRFLMLLALHLFLFPGFVAKLWKDLKTIRENFKTEDDY